MVVQVGDNIISALGFTTAENFDAVKAGRSGIRLHENYRGMLEPLCGALIDAEQAERRFAELQPPSDDYTMLEKVAILSVAAARRQEDIDLARPDVLFVFSSTKGNVYLLDETERDVCREHLFLWHSAGLVADFFGNPNEPIVISNACISGSSAQLAAARALESGAYKYVVVTGVDMLSRFIVAGFQSLKALSAERCRPFDRAHCGLNLGEAASTIIYSNAEYYEGVRFLVGAIRNDANHISGPSRTGEGAFRALEAVLAGIDINKLSFINTHGTATVYNDRMEAIALTRAGLNAVPVNSLKEYFGHTLGAAGIVETVIASHALRNGIILPTLSCMEQEPDTPLNICTRQQPSDKKYFVKMLSGFGGCNAALLFGKN
ncbi:MAG: beta-ketoacyl synthase [Bacteroidales bacterium]|jgi:3-oxoacyl-[acyl-carrier-protein] synthase-1|nr:beta-ketoacyl synthase [Bacteroidales bacterium]